MIEEIRLPEISENVDTAQVVRILVSVGDEIVADQSVVELESEKAIFEVPSPSTGKVIEINVKMDQVIKVGHVIAKIETAREGEEVREETTETPPEVKKPKAAEEEKPKETEVAEPTQPLSEERVPAEKPIEPQVTAYEAAPAAPSVRRLARELGLDIHQVLGSGPGGRISVDDVKGYAKQVVSGSPGVVPEVLPDFSKWGPVRREPMSKVRTLTAEHLSISWTSVPHVTQFDKADVTQVEVFRKKYAKATEEAGGKLTVTAILLKIAASALKVFPQFNASIDMTKREIVYKDYCHIGVAVDTDRGLLVPVVRDADKKGIVKLSVELTDLAERSRTKKIIPGELEGGNFTISNLGGIGGTSFTPIVYPPQVAILGVSRARQEPILIDNQFEPRLMLPLSLSYDHRIIDGADGIRFLRWIVNALEDPLFLLLEGEM